MDDIGNKDLSNYENEQSNQNTNTNKYKTKGEQLMIEDEKWKKASVLHFFLKGS